MDKIDSLFIIVLYCITLIIKPIIILYFTTVVGDHLAWVRAEVPQWVGWTDLDSIIVIDKTSKAPADSRNRLIAFGGIIQCIPFFGEFVLRIASRSGVYEFINTHDIQNRAIRIVGIRYIPPVDAGSGIWNIGVKTTIGYFTPTDHVVVELVNHFTVFVPTGQIKFTVAFSTKFPLPLIHNGLEEIFFLAKYIYISIDFATPVRRFKCSPSNAFQAFLRVLTWTELLVYRFGIEQQYIGKTHPCQINSCTALARGSQWVIHFQFRPFSGR